MARYDLTAEEARELLAYDPTTGELRWRVDRSCGRARAGWRRCKGRIAGGISKANGYRIIVIERTDFKAHRLAWLIHFGVWPAAYLDHINGDKADNRIANLREATPAQSTHNRGRMQHNKSGFKGIYFDTKNGKWRARACVGGKRTCLGWFDSPEAAHAAYCSASAELHGEFFNGGAAA